MPQALRLFGSARALGPHVARSSGRVFALCCAMVWIAMSLVLSFEPVGHPNIGVRISSRLACSCAFCWNERACCFSDCGSTDMSHDVVVWAPGASEGCYVPLGPYLV